MIGSLIDTGPSLFVGSKESCLEVEECVGLFVWVDDIVSVHDMLSPQWWMVDGTAANRWRRRDSNPMLDF